MFSGQVMLLMRMMGTSNFSLPSLQLCQKADDYTNDISSCTYTIHTQYPNVQIRNVQMRLWSYTTNCYPICINEHVQPLELEAAIVQTSGRELYFGAHSYVPLPPQSFRRLRFRKFEALSRAHSSTWVEGARKRGDRKVYGYAESKQPFMSAVKSGILLSA